jgi:hypothetical protein
MEPQIPERLWPGIRRVDFDQGDYSGVLERIQRAGGIARTVGSLTLATQISRFDFPRAMETGSEEYVLAQLDPLWLLDQGEYMFAAYGHTLRPPE